MQRRTWKMISAMTILGKNVPNEKYYSELANRGYIWHAGKQKWLKTLDEEQMVLDYSTTKEKTETEEMVFDMENAKYVGSILMPCQHCHIDIVYHGYHGKAIFGDNRIEDVIANFSKCPFCGNDSFGHIEWSRAIEMGMVQEFDDKPKNKKPFVSKKGLGRTH